MLLLNKHKIHWQQDILFFLHLHVPYLVSPTILSLLSLSIPVFYSSFHILPLNLLRLDIFQKIHPLFLFWHKLHNMYLFLFCIVFLILYTLCETPYHIFVEQILPILYLDSMAHNTFSFLLLLNNAYHQVHVLLDVFPLIYKDFV